MTFEGVERFVSAYTTLLYGLLFCFSFVVVAFSEGTILLYLMEGCLDQIGGKSVYLSSSLTTRNNRVRTCATVTSPMRTSQQARWERDGALEPNLDLHIISDIKPKPKPSPGHI